MGINWLFTKFIELPWWAMILWVCYLLYFISRAYSIWYETTQNGLKEGYKREFFGYEKDVRLYHIVRIIFDVPPALLGLTFPIIKSVLRLKLYTFKQKEAETHGNQTD